MTDPSRRSLVSGYIDGIKNASNEQVKKEKFLTLMTQLFAGHDQFDIIRQFTAGAERRITHIKREGKKTGRGRADTQYGSVIIEFEHDLKKTGLHAVDQLKEYVCGNWNSGLQVGFTLIATDCLTWEIYTLDFDSLAGWGSLDADSLHLVKVGDTFTVSATKADEFYYFLDRYLFFSHPLPATLEDIRKGFGAGSEIFQTAMQTLHAHYTKVRDTASMQTAYSQWHKFLSIAYGKFDASEQFFLTQSYLSILAKMLAYEVLTGDDFIDDNEIKEIMNGEAFKRKNIDNFTSEDFFRWTAIEENHHALQPVFRSIAQGLSRFDFSIVHEDILKGVYQELVDEDTRHALGEHYTPDWLASHIVETVDPKPGQKILDPSCGSGSFLKAVANHLIAIKPDITAQDLNGCLYGIDVHPLSVQITKATLIVALGKRIQSEPRPIALNIFLANTLLLPKRGDLSLLGKRYKLSIDNKVIEVNETVLADRRIFHNITFDCDCWAAADVPLGITRIKSQMLSAIKRRYNTADQAFIDSVYELYKAFSSAKLAGRDSIWAYIINNSYSPYFLQEQFDAVVGNPPWLTFRDVDNGDYQDELKRIAVQYNALPKKQSGRPHLELAALFLAHCANYFMKPEGRLAFVMPRSFLSADQHDNTRSGKLKRVKITGIWDLKEVAPLFKVPSCVLLAARGFDGAVAPKTITGREYAGRLSAHNAKRAEANSSLAITEGYFYLSRLGNATAWSFGKNIHLGGNNPYRTEFQQGATIVPRLCYFVDIDQEYDGDLHDRLLRVKSSNAVKREAKKPWNEVDLRGAVHSRFLFRSALANNVVPFSLNGHHLVALPAMLENGRLRLFSPDALMNRTGELESRDWFAQVEKTWDAHKTERNKAIRFTDYLDWMNKLSEQNLNCAYTVIYTASGANCVSVVVDNTKNEALPFIVEHKTYMHFTNDKHEAFYLCAFLNSQIPNQLMKPFQTSGLLGPRDIETKILEVPLPRFDDADARHLDLANAAERAAIKARAYVSDRNSGPFGGNLTSTHLGRFRNEVREHLSTELREIDSLLASVLGFD